MYHSSQLLKAKELLLSSGSLTFGGQNSYEIKLTGMGVVLYTFLKFFPGVSNQC